MFNRGLSLYSNGYHTGGTHLMYNNTVRRNKDGSFYPYPSLINNFKVWLHPQALLPVLSVSAQGSLPSDLKMCSLGSLPSDMKTG